MIAVSVITLPAAVHSGPCRQRLSLQHGSLLYIYMQMATQATSLDSLPSAAAPCRQAQPLLWPPGPCIIPCGQSPV